MNLPNKIREYLEDSGISQTFVANKTGIPTTALNMILNNKRRLLAEEYFLICEALEKDANFFLGQKED